MAITVRKGVFETNSSSTHSISIEEIEYTDDQILKNGVLDLNKLWECSVDTESLWEGTTVLVCDTYVKKLGLAFCLISEESSQFKLLIDTFNIEKIIDHGNQYIGDENDQFDKVFEAITNDALKITYIYEYN